MAIAERIESAASVTQRQAERQAELDIAKAELAAAEHDVTVGRARVRELRVTAEVDGHDNTRDLKSAQASVAKAEARTEILRERVADLGAMIPAYEARATELRRQERLAMQQRLDPAVQQSQQRLVRAIVEFGVALIEEEVTLNAYRNAGGQQQAVALPEMYSAMDALAAQSSDHAAFREAGLRVELGSDRFVRFLRIK